MNPAKNHPNATVAGASGGSAAALVTILAAFGIDIPLELGVWAVAAAPVVALAIGRRGIKGIGKMVWEGDKAEVTIEHADTVNVTEAPKEEGQ